MAIVVQGARVARLYPPVGKYGGHVGYQFGNQWYMVVVEQQRRGDDFDLYWDETLYCQEVRWVSPTLRLGWP